MEAATPAEESMEAATPAEESMEAGTDAQNDAAQTAAAAGLLRKVAEIAAAASELLATTGAATGAATEPPPLSIGGGSAPPPEMEIMEMPMAMATDETSDDEEREGPGEFSVQPKRGKGKKGGPRMESYQYKDSRTMGVAEDKRKREAREKKKSIEEGGGSLEPTLSGSRKRKAPTRFTSRDSESMFFSVPPASPVQHPSPESISAAAPAAAAAAAPRPPAGS